MTANDIKWWTGFPISEVKEFLNKNQKDIITTNISGFENDFLMTKRDNKLLENTKVLKTDTINFLPRLDPYIMGYKDRSRYVDKDRYNYVFDKSGNATSTIILNGKVIGVWDHSDKPVPAIRYFLFERHSNNIMYNINVEAHRIGKFIADNKVKTKQINKMEPLNKRTVGGFMTPLKFN